MSTTTNKKKQKAENNKTKKPSKQQSTDEGARILFVGEPGKKPSKKDTPISIVPKLANPVTLMANKIESLLWGIPNVITEFDYADRTVWVYVSDPTMLEGFKFFLKRKHELGNLTLNVKLVSTYKGKTEEVDKPSYKITPDEMASLFGSIFKEPYSPDWYMMVDQAGVRWDFFEFPNCGVVYQADSLKNVAGYDSSLVADLVDEVFDVKSFKISSKM